MKSFKYIFGCFLIIIIFAASYDEIGDNSGVSIVATVLVAILFIYIVYVNYFKKRSPKNINIIANNTKSFLEFITNKNTSDVPTSSLNKIVYFKKETTIKSILTGWTLFHFILFYISDGTKDRFWPFDNEAELKSDYDFSEFFIYGLIPWIVLIVFKFLKKRTM